MSEEVCAIEMVLILKEIVLFLIKHTINITARILLFTGNLI